MSRVRLVEVLGYNARICDFCARPLREDPKDGCVAGLCSQRPVRHHPHGEARAELRALIAQIDALQAELWSIRTSGPRPGNGATREGERCPCGRVGPHDEAD